MNVLLESIDLNMLVLSCTPIMFIMQILGLSDIIAFVMYFDANVMQQLCYFVS